MIDERVYARVDGLSTGRRVADKRGLEVRCTIWSLAAAAAATTMMLFNAVRRECARDCKTATRLQLRACNDTTACVRNASTATRRRAIARRKGKKKKP